MAEPEGLRHAAIAWLEQRTFDRQISLTRDEIADFEWNGQPFRLIPSQQGIWKPRGFEATLSIVTTYRSPGQKRPYADEVGADGLIRYKWRGDDPQHPENVGLRQAMQLRQPIIWFIGIGGKPPEYQVVAPVYLVREEPDLQQFVMAPLAEEDFAVEELDEGFAVPALKRYLMRETKVRLHQPVFRSTVLMAYEDHCAVCNLAHPELLDAAHIVDDSHELGTPTVGNGMALCKIHHAAFDRRFLGIRPTPDVPVVEIRQDLLEEVDGPMLRHGLQDLHGKPLMMLPRVKANRPDRDKLMWAYDRFQSATIVNVA
ncbi:HNH endonuclease [Micrococcus sp. HG099]|uniref:HNH endonuclease n=1 Tax=Micrococcus sp. HG099 TaxID=2969755 RepID=UPI00215A0FD2|nr:HNH endonuclease signature motif containing protein [Micrococcus sp. HG099]MCR8675450.1 HNH endonuclease [Micrococcus sp. HG099]